MFLALPPGALGRGQKVKYYLISIAKSISKIFIPNFLCVHTNERYKTYQTVISILLPGSCPRGGIWGYLGAKIKFHTAVCPLCYILLNHWTKFNQIWYVSYSHEWDAQSIFFWLHPLGPWGGVKRSNIINLNYKVNFKDFYSKLCVCSHKLKIQSIIDGIIIM